MKRTMVLTILGLATTLSFSAHAYKIPGSVAYVTLQCTKVQGLYPANVIQVSGAVSAEGQIRANENDPNGFRIEFVVRDPSESGKVSMRAVRNFAGNYYYSEFNCTGEF